MERPLMARSGRPCAWIPLYERTKQLARSSRLKNFADMTAGKLGSEPHVGQPLGFADARVDECLDILR
jgi:hypothetical protein